MAVIGSWYCLPEGELSREALEAYRDIGFTHFQTLELREDVWVPYARDTIREALHLCEVTGLRCFVADDRVYRGERPYAAAREPAAAEIDAALADHAASPAFAGYLVYDEPSPHAFPALARTIAHLRSRAPNAVTLIPLFPMHDDPRFPNNFEGLTYGEYVRSFVRTCRPQVLAFDYYPFFDTAARMPQYRENLAIARDAASEAGLPLWFYIGISRPPGADEPTLARLRFQVDAALEFGASAIFAFTYRDATRCSDDDLRAINREIARRLA